MTERQQASTLRGKRVTMGDLTKMGAIVSDRRPGTSSSAEPTY
jgi:hypothetical protein